MAVERSEPELAEKKVRQKTPQDRRNIEALRTILRRRLEEGPHASHALLLVELERQLGRVDEARSLLARATGLIEPVRSEVRDEDEDLIVLIGCGPNLPLGAGWIGGWTGPRELGALARAQARQLEATNVSVEALSFRDA